MVTTMPEDARRADDLVYEAATGDEKSWGGVIAQHRDRLRRLISFRLDQRLRGRVDASDVIQEVFLEAWQHLNDFVREPSLPFFLWLRGIAGNKLRELHRHHLGTQMRDARREVSLYHGALPETTSAALAAQLLGHCSRPSEQAIRAETKV